MVSVLEDNREKVRGKKINDGKFAWTKRKLF